MAEKQTEYEEPAAEGIAYLKARGFVHEKWDRNVDPVGRPIPRLELSKVAVYANCRSGEVIGLSGTTPWNPTNCATEALVNGLAYMVSENRNEGGPTLHTEPGVPIPVFIIDDTEPSWEEAVEALTERFPPAS